MAKKDKPTSTKVKQANLAALTWPLTETAAGGIEVVNAANREPARDPQDLERFLVARQWAGDIDGMLALFEPDAVVDIGDGRLAAGHKAIRDLYLELVATGRKFEMGEQRPALVSGGLALTSTSLSDGSVTSEVARRQPDGSWLWVLDKYSAK